MNSKEKERNLLYFEVSFHKIITNKNHPESNFISPMNISKQLETTKRTLIPILIRILIPILIVVSVGTKFRRYYILRLAQTKISLLQVLISEIVTLQKFRR